MELWPRFEAWPTQSARLDFSGIILARRREGGRVGAQRCGGPNTGKSGWRAWAERVGAQRGEGPNPEKGEGKPEGWRGEKGG